MKWLLFFFITIFFSCTSNVEQEILSKIQLFEVDKAECFSNISIKSLRAQKKPKVLEFEVRKQKVSGYAIIQTKPEQKILKNFFKDSLDLEFVKSFDNLDVRTLINTEGFTKMESIIDDNKIIIFSGIPPNNFYLPFDTSKSFSVNRDWKYFITPFRGEG